MGQVGLENWLPLSIEPVVEDRYSDTSAFGSRVKAARFLLSAGHTKESVKEQHGACVLCEALAEIAQRNVERAKGMR